VQQRVRDVISGPLRLEYLQQRLADGWTPVAVEWVRTSEEPARASVQVETPYGFQVSEDGKSLEPNPDEIDVLYVILEQIVSDKRFTQIAEELNRRQLKRRTGQPWTSTAVFELLPQLVEAGPFLLKNEEWARRRREIVASLQRKAG
jgi:hypothetical protein